MIVALTVLALVLPALILVAWHLDRRDRLAELAAIRAEQQAERERWTDERRELLNRIKPETAQYPQPKQTAPTPVPLFDNDTSYWASQTERMSKDELADAVEAMERQMAGATMVPAMPPGGAES